MPYCCAIYCFDFILLGFDKTYSSEGRQEGEKSIADEVEKLLGQISDDVLPENRREALMLLSEVLQGDGQVFTNFKIQIIQDAYASTYTYKHPKQPSIVSDFAKLPIKLEDQYFDCPFLHVY